MGGMALPLIKAELKRRGLLAKGKKAFLICFILFYFPQKKKKKYKHEQSVGSVT